MILYFSGAIVDVKHPRLCFMNTPQMNNHLHPNLWWAADNGRFNAPEKYSDHSYLDWLSTQRNSTCFFATAPDCLADHDATVELSQPMFPRIRELGYRPAFVMQDGWKNCTTPWKEFDCLFIGGTTNFKLGWKVIEGINIARSLKKWVHMGRVNSFKRLLYAAQIGCHSADGTYLKYGPRKLVPKMLSWFDQLTEMGY